MLKKNSSNNHVFKNKRKSLLGCVILGSCALLSSQQVSAAVISDLFGTWNGTWDVDKKFSGLTPLSPPFSPVGVQFNIGPFDPIAGNYGALFVDSAASGIISLIEVTGNDVKISIDYPTLGFLDSAFVKGVLTGNTILGNFDETPTAGFITWQGPLDITKTVVPIPAAVWLFGTGLIGIVGFARRKS